VLHLARHLLEYSGPGEEPAYERRAVVDMKGPSPLGTLRRNRLIFDIEVNIVHQGEPCRAPVQSK
jgi:hypothetical protein